MFSLLCGERSASPVLFQSTCNTINQKNCEHREEDVSVQTENAAKRKYLTVHTECIVKRKAPAVHTQYTVKRKDLTVHAEYTAKQKDLTCFGIVVT